MSLVINIFIAVDRQSCVDTALWSVVVVVDFESLSFGSEAMRRTRLCLYCTVTFRLERDSCSNHTTPLTTTTLTRSANNQ